MMVRTASGPESALGFANQVHYGAIVHKRENV